MNLHEDKEKFEQLIQLTANSLEIPEVYVEKDYWVTYMLYNLYNGTIKHFDEDTPLKDLLVFKGGTSLSKGYKYIDRFSEDVDLVLLKKDYRFDDDNERILKKAQKVIATNPLKQNKTHPDSRDSKFYKKKIYDYEKIDEGADFYHALPYIILELNFFSEPTPVKDVQLSSYIYEFLEEQDGLDDISRHSLEPFSLKLLCTTRTFLEKIVALYRGAYKSKEELQKRIRHFYDIHMLITKDKMVQELIEDEATLLQKVNYLIGEEKHHETFCDICEFLPLSESSFSKDIESYRSELKEHYEKSFSSLLYNQKEMPDFDEVFDSFIKINNFLKAEKV